MENINNIPLINEEVDKFGRKVSEYTKIGMFRCGFDAIIQYIDRGALRIFELDNGFPDPKAVIGKNLSDIIIYSNPEEILNRDLFEKGFTYNREYNFKIISGKEKWVFFYPYLIIDSETGNEAIQVVIQDITEQKKDDRSLNKKHTLESEENFSNIFNNAQGVVVVSEIHECKIFEFNELLTQKIEHESVGELVDEHFTPETDIVPITWESIANGVIKNIRPYEDEYCQRFFGIIISLTLLILLFPVSFLFALLQKLESKGPLFLMQKRMGYRGKEFNLIKFRTMVNNAEKYGACFTKENDERITKIGRIMRKFYFDEVPQLINILKGDLNLIGPRPERKEFLGILEKEIPFYKKRLEVKPGLTGWAQVKSCYAGTYIEDHLKKLEYDLYYIKNKNIPLDTLIILKTVKAVLGRKGT